MRVLIITQYFDPESNFRSGEMAYELSKRGYSVDALVGIPNYPAGKYFNGYGVFKKRNEFINGVHIHRVFQTPRGKGGWRLPVNYFSFVVSACINILFCYAWKKKYDAIIVHEPSPIFQAIPAILLKKIRKTPVCLWILDIWPDAMRSGGGVSNERLIRFIDKIVVWIYKRCDKLLISSKGMSDFILPKGDFEKKIKYFPNWSQDLYEGDLSYNIPVLPSGYNIFTIGNLGRSLNLDAIVKVIEAVKDIEGLNWVFVGDGSEKQWLQNYIEEHDLRNVYLLGKYPFEAMSAFHTKADALFLALRKGFPHLEAVVPSKLQPYLSSSRPVLAMIGKGGADIIKEANCGVAYPAGDYESIAQFIRNDLMNNIEAFNKKGANGRQYYLEHYTVSKCIDRLCEIINPQ